MPSSLLAKEISVPIGGTSLTQISLFARQFSVMLRAGLPISEILLILEEAASGKLKRVVQEISHSVQQGHTLHAAFSRYPHIFPSLFLGAVYIGETSGTLDKSLEYVAEQLEKERLLRSRIRGAMIYPTVVLSVAIILGGAMAFLVLPRLTSLLASLQVELPQTTRFLIWLSGFMQTYGTLIVPAFIVIVIFILALLRQPFLWPFTHWLLLHMPVVKTISRGANISRFCRTLATLLKSGVPIDESLDITKNSVPNYYYQQAIGEAKMHITKGTKLAQTFFPLPGLFPRLVTRMMHVGEESGKLEETLFYLADFYEAEVERATKSLSSTIEPLLLLLVGVVVAFLALAIITPIYNFTSGIEK